jgi:hypothetical protein
MEPKNMDQGIEGLYRIIPLKLFRRTPGVYFDILSKEALPRVDGFDRVIHEGGAISPGPVGNVERPWYMHPQQDDNLMVLHGVRYVELYTKRHGKIESFVVTPHRIEKNKEVVFEGPAMLVWPTAVFHRIVSSKELGSASLNFAVRYEGWNVRTNFNIYDLDSKKGTFRVIREGYLDQPGM